MRKLKLLLIWVFIMSLIVPMEVFAGGTEIGKDLPKQNTDKEETGKKYYLDEIVTSATRIPHLLKYVPVSVSVITEDQIKAANPQDVADVLEDVAGIKIERYGSMGANSTVHIRGLYSSHALVMVDGRPVNSPSLGSADLSWLSVDNIERIEVVRGPGSALYGANAVAGVINIITKSPPEEFTAKVTTSYGTWDTLITRLENGWKLGDFSYSVTANRKNSNGYRDNSAHESRDISAKLFYEFDKEVNLSLSGGHYHGRTENPGAKPAENFNMRTGSQQLLGNDEVSSLFDYHKDKRAYLNATFDTEHFKIKSYINYWDDNDHREWLDFFGMRHIADDEYMTRTYGGEFQYSIEVFEWNLLTAGGSITEDDFRVKGKEYDASIVSSIFTEWDADRRTVAAFIEDEINVGPLTLILGGRWDDPDDFDSQTSFKTSLLWAVWDSTNIRASYGESFSAPSLNDLYWPSDGFNRGNPDLEPETGKTYEVGIEQSFGEDVLVRATVFEQEVKDMIAWAPNGPVGASGNNMWQPSNLNTAEIRGVEVEGRVEFVRDLNFILSYTYLDGEQKNMELVNATTNELIERTRTLAYLPEHKLDLGLQYRNMFRIKGLGLNINVQYVSETFQYYQNWGAYPVVTMDTKELADYWTADLKLTKECEYVDIFFAVDNVFDEEYEIQFGSYDDVGYPMPGRSITGGASIKF